MAVGGMRKCLLSLECVGEWPKIYCVHVNPVTACAVCGIEVCTSTTTILQGAQPCGTLGYVRVLVTILSFHVLLLNKPVSVSISVHCK